MSDPVLTSARAADLAAVQAVSRWVSADGATLHLLDYGGSAPACIVIPGITSPAVAWDFVARELVDVVRLVVLDVRGRGLSSRASSYTSADYVSDVEAIWPALGLSEALLLGHSMGARIAAGVAAAGRAAVIGSILVDPPMSGPGRGPYPMSLETFQAQLRAAYAGITAEDVAAVYPTWPPSEMELRARWLATCDDMAIADSHAAFEREDFFDTWPAVPLPTVLIYGAESPVVTADAAAEAARTRPDATVVAVERAGHMIPWDNHTDFLECAREAMAMMLDTRAGT